MKNVIFGKEFSPNYPLNFSSLCLFEFFHKIIVSLKILFKNEGQNAIEMHFIELSYEESFPRLIPKNKFVYPCKLLFTFEIQPFK